MYDEYNAKIRNPVCVETVNNDFCVVVRKYSAIKDVTAELESHVQRHRTTVPPLATIESLDSLLRLFF